MSQFKIYKDQRFDTVNVERSTNISVTPISKFEYPQKGGILYEPTTEQIYYADGTQWLPLSSGGGGNNSVTYCMIKQGDLIVPSATSLILNPWTILPSPPYHDNTLNWDLGSGIYTADGESTVSFNVNVAWKGGISNIGNRVLRVVYKPAFGAPFTVKESKTQADADTSIETTQECNITLQMDIGDEAWVEVEHYSNMSLVLSSGNSTSVAGVEITT